MKPFDFEGWATKFDIRCSDGRIIRHGAFSANNGQTVPLVWNHQHDSADNVLGHAVLEEREDGYWARGTFNDTESGQTAKMLVDNGDIKYMSIYANKLKQNGPEVLHGCIREVSLVLAGANPGATIENVLMHGELADDEICMETVFEPIELYHSDENPDDLVEDNAEDTTSTADESKNDGAAEETTDSASSENNAEDTEHNQNNQNGDAIQHADKEEPEMADNKEKTIGDVLDTFTEEQRKVVDYLIAMALQENENNNGGSEMKHNAFDSEYTTSPELTHSDFKSIMSNATRNGSFRQAVLDYCANSDTLAHAVTDDEGNTVEYGIANIDYLFPDAKAILDEPEIITQDMEWVAKVLNGAKHSPFARVKTVHADITMDEARAKGYTKGNLKAEEVFKLLKRTTSPTTVYKKQKLDRDDIVDITDIDTVAFVKREMRLKYDEEIARAALLGDGRTPGTDDKISEDCIRPIYTDNEIYTVRATVDYPEDADESDKAKAFIRTCIKSRKDYKGSGRPTLFTTEDMLANCLLIEDGTGRIIYDSIDKLKTALLVRDIVTVPYMENQYREGASGDDNTYGLLGILVNMADYTFGADKGGQLAMFEDFDIDFNQMKYLMETRCSGALTKYHSAVAIEEIVDPDDING